MKRFLCLLLLCFLAMSPMVRAGELISVASYFEGFTAYDARVRASGSQGEVASYGLIREDYNLGLDGDGKENAKLATQTMNELELPVVELEQSQLPPASNWHFDVSIFMDGDSPGQQSGMQREVTLSFYNHCRDSQLTITESAQSDGQGSTGKTVYTGWVKLPIAKLKVFEDLYLRRVCALVPDWSEEDE